MAKPRSVMKIVGLLQGSRPDEALDLELALPVRSQVNQTADQEEEHEEPLYAAISSAATQGGRPRQADPPRGLGSFLPLPKREANPSTSGDADRCRNFLMRATMNSLSDSAMRPERVSFRV